MKKLPIGIAIAGILTLPLSANAEYTIQGTTKPQSGDNWSAIKGNAEALDQATAAIQDLDKRATSAQTTAEGAKRTADALDGKVNIATATATAAKDAVDGLKSTVDENKKTAEKALADAKDADANAKAAQSTATEANNRSQQNANNITAANDRITANSGRISALEISGLKGGQAYDMAVENKQAIKQEVQDRIDGDKQTLAASKAYTDSKYGQLSEAIEKNRKESFAGIAAALAASQVPQVTQGSYFSLGAGLGSYQGQNAVAVGMSARLGDNIVSKLTITGDTQQRTGMGAGFSVEW